MTDNSDYKKARTKLQELLPSVFKSQANEAVLENAFNRFLTKNETTRAAGYIGKGNPSAVVSRQLPEPTVHRQAFQLQPILNAKIGSVEYMAAWQDLLNELERLGVDIENTNQWGKVLQFNWAPPIDFDKLINYQDYYWYDPDALNSRPDYITIKNRCNSAVGYVNFWKRLVDEYGETIPIAEITSSGLGSPNEYDQFVFNGEYSRLFEVGFQMYVRESTNSQINRQTFDSVNLEYDQLTNITTVRFSPAITDNSVGGAVVSLTEQYSVAIVARDCACGGDSGWDTLQWDDNPRNPQWQPEDGNSQDLLDHEAWLASVSNPGPPTGTPLTNQVWYDTDADILYEYDVEGLAWVALLNNFSTTLQNTNGTALWDAADCGSAAAVPSALQWVESNKWIHKTDVPNLTVAKRAQYPIIEFLPNLELNEWTVVFHRWKYRSGTANVWEDASVSPGLIELKALTDFEKISATLFELDPSYGDQTSWFIPGRQFATTNGEVVTVKQSFFGNSSAGSPTTSLYRTTVEIENTNTIDDVALPAPELIPLLTSNGDLWRGYGEHWVYDGYSTPSPIGHQRENPSLATTSSEIAAGTYTYVYGPYTQVNTMSVATPTPSFVLDSSLRNKALLGFDDIRVYVNDVRQYGTYEEATEVDLSVGSDTEYVAGITFLAEYVPTVAGQQIRIEVGPASVFDMGWSAVPVRTSIDSASTQNVSLVRYRKIEQVKSSINQYPIFDLYNVDGTYAYQANPIFMFQTSPDAKLQPALGLRVVMEETPRDYGFVQHLISADNETLYAYRDYANEVNAYWYNPSTNSLKIWDTLKWCSYYELDYGSGVVLVKPIISSQIPLSSDIIGGVVGCLWFDPASDILRRRISTGAGLSNWLQITNLALSTSDDSLQTIWKKGLYNEEYIPAKVDWQGRSEAEYNSERSLFIEERAQELALTGTESQAATTQATEEWYDSQVNKFSSTGAWVGDWEIPDPLYYNNLHENRKEITYREVLTHFTSIINAQPAIPGYAGPRTSMFHLIPPEDVNYGLGGHIKEFNDGVDTFLSSLFVNNVTPTRLVEFAHDQYKSLLNSLSETYRRNLLQLLTDTSQSSLLDFSQYVSHYVITEYEQSDNTALVYGDTTTFTEVDGTNDIGMRNWIITLPYLKLIHATVPLQLMDESQNISAIRHHDGHIDSYALPQSTTETISRAVTMMSDSRTTNDTFGRISSSAPPSSAAAFAASFNSSIENREGVYWFYVPPAGDRLLYRLTLVGSSTAEPSSVTADGALWFDVGTNTLRIKNGLSWDVVPGLTVGDGLLDNSAGISAWSVVDFNQILNDIILGVETKLYENAPAFETSPYDLGAASQLNPVSYRQYLEEELLNYALEQGIVAPYRNSNYTATDVWTWNYASVAITDSTGPYPHPDQDYTGSDISGGDWRDLYQKVYGTPYPHLEPWKLLNYNSKPAWWDEEYTDQTGTRRWTPAMWTNILTASPSIPAGERYPNGVVSLTGDYGLDQVAGLQVPTFHNWNHVSVNTTASSVVNGDGSAYQPDDLLPPIFTLPVVGAGSLFTEEPAGLTPAADYVFGDAGPIEWEWRASSYYNYDSMVASFRTDPIRYITHTFGKTFYYIGGLQIDSDTSNTFCHRRTDFHGEVVGDQPYLVNGTNQWYVNYNRYTGFDNNYSNFHALWTLWTAPMTYQMSSFIDTQSFILGHRNVDVTSFDWRITSKRSPGVDDYWYDAFKIALLEIPPPTARYNNESQWVFEVGTNLPLSRTIKYYDIMNYQFYADPDTDICSLYTYDVVGVDTSNNRFAVSGDQTQLFIADRTFAVEGSTGNDGTYTVISSFFDVGTNQTLVTVTTIPSSTADGLIKLNYRDIPWVTGDRVFLTTQETLPHPLLNETEYFIIVLNEREFKIASSAADALANNAIDLSTSGRRNHFVGRLNATFLALDGARTSVAWKHYATDKNNVVSLTLPAEISGIQNIVNIIDGYEAYGYDQGWRINDNGRNADPNLGRTVSWQVEIERFIDYIYGIRTQRNRPISTKYEIVTNNTTDTFTFTNQYGEFLTGDPVVFSSDTGVLPAPLLPRIKYYVIRTALMTFKVAGSKRDAEQGIAIDLTIPGGSPSTYNTLWVSPAQPRVAITTFELNPFRNGIDFRPERGIVSNVLEGPSEDVRTSQLVFDQYGRPLGRNNIRVYRQDKQTHLAVPDQIFNDVELSSVYNNEYNYLHLGGAHLFVDAHEHVLIFNNYTSENQLLYDPFIGLNVTKFELQFRRQEDFTQRPNVGGYYLDTFYSQNVGLKRNIEASIEDMRFLYDTYVAPETETLIINSRKALGYEGTREYMNNLNVGPKSQFIFWRGMIQQKGSLNTIQAFINSRRFLDAKIDEFWAVKVAEFGAASDKEYPELFLTTEDARGNDIRIEFVTDDQLCLPGYAMNSYDKNPCGYAFPEDGESVLIGSEGGFVPVSITDEDRWHNQPDVLEMLRNNGATMYFTMKPVTTIPVYYEQMSPGIPTSPVNNDGVILLEDTTYAFKRWNASAQIWEDHGSWDPSTNILPTLRHGMKADAIQVTLTLNSDTAERKETFRNKTGKTLTLSHGYIPYASNIRVWRHQAFEIVSVTSAPYVPGSPYLQSEILVSGDLTGRVTAGDTINITSADPVDPSLPGTSQMTLKVAGVAVSGSPYFTTLTVVGPAGDTYAGSPAYTNYKFVTFGKEQISGVDYAETLAPGNSLLSNIIQFPQALGETDIITVSNTTAVLSENVHYRTVNADVIEFIYPQIYTGIDLPDAGSGVVDGALPSTFYLLGDQTTRFASGNAVTYTDAVNVDSDPLNLTVSSVLYNSSTGYTSVVVSQNLTSADPSFVGTLENISLPTTNTYYITNLKIWGFVQDDHAQDPAKIIDVISNTVVTSVPMWDPAHGLHYHNAVHNVDLMKDLNPARFNNTLLATQPIESGDKFTRVVPSWWGKEQVGITWMDTSLLEYVRYYDPNAFIDVNTRLGYWGRLADWSSTKVYEWVESDVPPAEWNEAAELEENNNTLPEETRKAGRTYKTLFRTTPKGTWERLVPTVQEYDIAVEGTPVYAGSPAELVAYNLTIGSTTESNGIVFPAAFVSGGTASMKTFEMVDDYTSLFYVGDKILYTDTGNSRYAAPTINTEFTIADIVYNAIDNKTTITVNEEVVKYFTAEVYSSPDGSPPIAGTEFGNRIILTGDVSSFVGVGTVLTLSGMQYEENNTTFVVTGTDSVIQPDSVVGTVGVAWGGSCYPPLTNNSFGYASTRTLLYPLAEISPCPFGSITATELLDGNQIAAFYHYYVPGGGDAREVVLEVYCPAGDVGENFITGITVGTTSMFVGSGTYIGSDWNPTKGAGIPANIRRWRWSTTTTLIWHPSPAFTISFPAINLDSGTTAITVERLDGQLVSNGSPATDQVINGDYGATGYWSLCDGLDITVIDGGGEYGIGDIIEVRTTEDPQTYGDPAISYAYPRLRVTNVDGVTGAVLTVEVYNPGIYNTITAPTWPVGSPLSSRFVTVNGTGGGASFSAGATPFCVTNETPGIATITLQPSYEGLITSQETDAYNIDVYVNGLHTADYAFSIVTTIGSPTTHEYILRLPADTVKRADHITVVQPIPTGDRLSRGLTTGAYREEYEYTSVDYNDAFGNVQTKYYFWVQDKITKRAIRTLSPIETQQQIVALPSPYMFFQGVYQPTRVFVDGYPYDLPLRMVQNVIRGLRGIINDDRRYVIRYTRDYTLRDTLDAGKSSLQLKNKHTTWELIREEQPSKIRRELWDKVTESIIGETLDGTLRVPSLTRELYDTKYEADTRIGLGKDQAFADGTLALQAVLTYLTDPTNDFRPIDINTFFQQYSFDTLDNIKVAMNRIYTTFAAIHVNKIFFSVLHDAAFSQKTKYAELFKTSMIALHGVKPFQVGGLFDD